MRPLGSKRREVNRTMPFSGLDEKRQTRRSAEVNEGPKLGSDKLALSGGKWVS